MCSSDSKPRGRFDAVVEENQPVCREHYRLRLRIAGPRPFPATQPGQFIQIGCRQPNGIGLSSADGLIGHDLEWEPGQRPNLSQPELKQTTPLLRRPFSLAGRGDDERGTWVQIIHRVVGAGTAWLAQLQVGQPVDLIGPLGNAFTLPPGKSVGLMVGGGVGLPPMFYLAQLLQVAGWSAVGFVGALSRDLLAVQFDPIVTPDCTGAASLCIREFAQLGFPAVVTTDDASCGLRGRITAGLETYLKTQTPQQAAQTVIFTCGPEPMMRAVAALAAAYHIDCQVCMEQAMACGMGTCQSCIVKIEDRDKPQATNPDGRPWRYRLTCTDGPVFDAKVVVW